MTKQQFDNLPPDRKMEELNRMLKTGERLTDEMDIKDLFGDIFKQPTV